MLRGVYHNDALTQKQNLSAEERLHFHREHSAPLIEALHDWMKRSSPKEKRSRTPGSAKLSPIY
jgi:hypothetical protein